MQERAVRLMIEIELRQQEEAAVLQMRTNRVFAQMAGLDFNTEFVGTGTALPPGESATVTTEAEVDQVVAGNDATIYQAAEDQEFTEADFLMLMGEASTQKFNASNAADSLWGDPV